MSTNKSLAPTASIEAVVFSIRGTDDVITESCSNVYNKELTKDGHPYANGPLNRNLGTTDIQYRCDTCQNNKILCQGHHGHINLKYPVKSPLFIKEIQKYLKILCFNCGSLIKTLPKYNEGECRLTAIGKSITKPDTTYCSVCNAKYVKTFISKENSLIILKNKEIIETKKPSHEELYNHEIRDIFNKVTDETLTHLNVSNMSHPKKFILNAISVPPNQLRPSIKKDSAKSSSNDTTNLLKIIIEQNEKLPDIIPEVQKLTTDLISSFHNLDIYYFSMIRGNVRGDIKLQTNTNKTPTSILDKIKGKKGHIRNNLMGKKVGNIMRCVINCNASLRINEVGVPYKHARNITMPETVTYAAINRLQQYLDNTYTDNYPSCKKIIRNGREFACQTNIPSSIRQLQVGDTIHRDLINGDIVSFNRQPSLLFSAIAGLIVKVVDGEALQINPAVCNYFNADFDGDQMHAIIHQNIYAQLECRYLSGATRWLISPQKATPLVGAFQDALIGLSEITQHGVSFDKWNAMFMIGKMDLPAESYNFTKTVFTARELVSKTLPIFNYSNTATIYKKQYEDILKFCPEDIKVVIKNGELISGVLDTSSTGKDVQGSIFHVIANSYGNAFAFKVVYNLQQIVHNYLIYKGFTLGMKDIYLSDATKTLVRTKINNMKLKSDELIYKVNKGKLIPPLDMTVKEFYEIEQGNLLATNDSITTTILSDIDHKNNGLFKLINTGSKGKIANFLAIGSVLGFQTISGKRFPSQVSLGRTSPYFHRYDLSPEANGFVEHSYSDGTESHTYPFIAAEARDGFIKNALMTSVTGSQNRASNKNLETISVNNRKCASKSNNIIVQPIYGECGLHPSKFVRVTFNTVNLSDSDFTKQYNALNFVKDPSPTLKDSLEREFKALSIDRSTFRTLILKLERIDPIAFTYSNSQYITVNVDKIIDNSKLIYSNNITNTKFNSESNLLNAINTVHNLIERIRRIFFSKHYTKSIPEYIETTFTLLFIHIRSTLCIANLVNKDITVELLSIIVDEIFSTFTKSIVDSGFNVGLLASQCLSENLTQYVLDSRHRVSVGSSKSNTIERIGELYNAKTSVKKPQMTINVISQYENNENKVQEIANYIEMMNFGRFVLSECVLFEEYGKVRHPQFINDQEVIDQINSMSVISAPSDLTPWCIRFGISREELIQRSLSLRMIVSRLNEEHSDEAYFVASPEIHDNLFVRCYLRQDTSKRNSNFFKSYVLPFIDTCNSTTIRGISGIIRTEVISTNKTYIDKSGAIATKKIYNIITNGSNLSEVLQNKYIDGQTSYTNNLYEVYDLFGIEAYKTRFISELCHVVGKSLHNTIYASELCSLGVPSSLNSTGLSARDKNNSLLKIAFQKVLQNLQQAALNNNVSAVDGCSSNTILGICSKLGSTYNKVVRDFSYTQQTVAASINIDDI